MIEDIYDKKNYRPYKTCKEMIEDYGNRFEIHFLDSFTYPSIWLRKANNPGLVFLITQFLDYNEECKKNCVRLNNIETLDELLENYVYINETPVGVYNKEQNKDG